MLCKKESILLKKLSIENNLIQCDFEVSEGLKHYFNYTKMFIKYTENVNLEKVPKSILYIPFITSILPLAWLTDSILWVEEIDKTFYQSLTRVKNAYQEIYDYYPLKGSLIPAKILENNYQIERESLILFSGGLDAQTTYLRNMSSNPILCNIQGWYKENFYEKNEIAEKDINDITEFSKRENRDFEYVKSNFANIINLKSFRKIEKKLKDSWWHGFQHSIAFITISIPLCYFYKVKTIYIASSFSLGDEGRCASYPTTDSEFTFANIGNVVHDGFELSRQDKVSLIVKHQKQINKIYPIKVCTFNEENCLMCEKCVRTMLGIIAENGDVRDFGFNVKKDLLEHFLETFNEKNIIFFDVKGESEKHWKYIKEKMKLTYDENDYKDIIDWFLNEDLINERKKEY